MSFPWSPWVFVVVYELSGHPFDSFTVTPSVRSRGMPVCCTACCWNILIWGSITLSSHFADVSVAAAHQ